jgi:sialate O-acetylesterase
MKHIITTLLFLSSLVGTSLYAVELNSLFSDNIVLQRDKPLPIWGTGRDGEKITVQLGKDIATTTVSGGNWTLKLKSLPAGGPFTLNVIGDETRTINNVLIGDVWICSGQSNMERQLGPRGGQLPLVNWEQEVASANHPEIRMFFVHRDRTQIPAADAKGKWIVCTPQTANDFSAIGYFFAQTLQADIKVPIGMIFNAVGGTAIDLWISPTALASIPAGEQLIQRTEQDILNSAEKVAEFKLNKPELLKKYDIDVAAAKAAGLPGPRPPSAPRDLSDKHPSCLFNGMVAPLIPYAIKGAIWYQGESDSGRGKLYRELFPLMIHDWRSRWQQGDFPFCFVQLATYRGNDPMVREAQFISLTRAPNTAMVVTTDLGEADNIHPIHKREVGERLALAARALAYEEKIESSGPLLQSSEIKNGKVILHFSHAKGLTAKGTVLTGFVIAGADKKFVSADAVIVDETVIVSCPTVSAPIATRYNWAGVAEGNLYNSTDLPASPFRTDVDPD